MGRAGARLSSAARAPVHPAVPSCLRRHRARARNQAAGCRLRLRSGRDPGRRARRHRHRAGRRRGARRPGPPAPPPGRLPGRRAGGAAVPCPLVHGGDLVQRRPVRRQPHRRPGRGATGRHPGRLGGDQYLRPTPRLRDARGVRGPTAAAATPTPGAPAALRAVGAGPAGGAGSTGRAHPDPRGRGGLPVRLSRRPDGLAGAVLSGAVPGRHPRRRRAAGAAGGRGRAGPYRTSGGGVRLEHSFRYLLARA
jgi:hypothetical protein